MYTTYGTGFGKFSQTYHIGTRKYGHKPGHQEQKEKKTPSRRKPHGFLNTRIPSIAPDLYVENDRDVTVNVTTKENLDFLYRSAMRYEFRFFASGNYLLPPHFLCGLKNT